jgi:serine/threonine protein kinase
MFSAGEKFSHYEITAKIGEGGMGEVYLATDTDLGRKVALKFLTSLPEEDRERARRFTREAKTASALNHPNILTIYEIGESDGIGYIAAEFIEGQSLREMLRRPIPLDKTLDIVMQALSAISTAHAADIVHRDIKPENIMVRDDGVVKVLDFGLAKLIEPIVKPPIGTESVTKELVTTSAGTVLGTAQYMSPEQARGLAVDARTDIWSLGVVLYEMITGRAPFKGDTASDLLVSILKTEPKPLSAFHPDTPPELEFITKKALGKDRDERYQDVKDFLLDLKLVKREFDSGSVSAETAPVTGPSARVTDGSGRPPTEPVAGSSRWKWALAVAAIAILGLGAAYVWFQRKEAGAQTALSSSQITSWKSELTDNDSSRARLSPDGKFVAYVATKNGKKSVWLKQIGGGDPFTRKQDDESEEMSPLWSPDGGQIAFLSERGGQHGIWQMPAFGGSQTLLSAIDIRSPGLVHWSKDTSKIYFEMKQNLYSLDLGTGTITRLTNFDETVFIQRGFSFSPDEKQMVFADRKDGRKDLWISELNGDNAVRLVDDAFNDSNPVWHPDGKRVIYNCERDGLQQICVAHKDRQSPDQLTFADGDSRISDISSDGTRILYTTSKNDSDIWGVSVDGGKEFQLTTDVGLEFWQDASPAGDAMAFQTLGRSNIGENIFHGSLEHLRITDGRRTRLVDDGFDVRFSPDGGKLAFMRAEAGKNSLWVMSASGGDAKQLTASGVVFGGLSRLPLNRTQTQDYQWSQDGSSIVYCAVRDGLSNVWRVAFDGGEIMLTNNQSKTLHFFGPALSRDGHQLAWTALNNEVPTKPRWSIWYEADGDEREIFQADGVLGLIGWNTHGDRLLLKSTDSPRESSLPVNVRVLEIDPNGAAPQELLLLADTYFQNLALAPDGRSLGAVKRTNAGDVLQAVPLSGANSKPLVTSNDPRVYIADLSFASDGKTVYYAKQANWQIISLLTNFK